MSMPKYPEERKIRSYKSIVKDILESAALEELAIAHLINAEAEKIQAFTGHYGGFPTSPSNKQINEFQGHVAKILQALSEKQKILVRTIELSKELIDESEETEEGYE
ncbi:hypothetical protein [Paenibacillus thalictri]|uniref:Restriction endonuclease subunit S n=1 Tax=Paenibacillus thalictri TaxID=2527873 RepID=A0A4Q9DNW4_9BACL|nr:hypothetical protein [Paenibacillus thalictri]TBL75292.1 hypothetical protein EYB31_23040 [Paenibacillus thalictri]